MIIMNITPELELELLCGMLIQLSNRGNEMGMTRDEQVEELCNFMDAGMMSVNSAKNNQQRRYATHMLYNTDYNRGNKYVKVYGNVSDWGGNAKTADILESAKRILISRLTVYNCENVSHAKKVINSVYGVHYCGRNHPGWTPSTDMCRGNTGGSNERERNRNGERPVNYSPHIRSGWEPY